MAEGSIEIFLTNDVKNPAGRTIGKVVHGRIEASATSTIHASDVNLRTIRSVEFTPMSYKILPAGSVSDRGSFDNYASIWIGSVSSPGTVDTIPANTSALFYFRIIGE